MLQSNKPLCHNYWAREPRACDQQQEKPLQWEDHALQLESSSHSPQLEKAHEQQQRPSITKKKKKKKKFF